MASLIIAGSLTSCATTENGEKNGSGKTAGGALAGAIAGGVLGNQVKGSKGTREGARIAGAVIGGVIGGSVGHYMDKQERELREQLKNSDIEVEREGDQIILNMPGQVTFEVGKATIQPSFYELLNKVAEVLNSYPETGIEVAGHTDSTGSAQLNQVLSEQRAQSVVSYLKRQGIQSQRLAAVGFGQSQPVASNNTADGRQENRRVEMTLIPPSSTSH
ncbi:MAG: OmpA family protein [Oligoflexus sp.]